MQPMSEYTRLKARAVTARVKAINAEELAKRTESRNIFTEASEDADEWHAEADVLTWQLKQIEKTMFAGVE